LLGLKENVILGKRVPAGTGFRSKLDMEGLPEVTSYEGISLVPETAKPSLLPSPERTEMAIPSLEMALVKEFLSGDGGNGGDGSGKDEGEE
jgi:hypothetical protein